MVSVPFGCISKERLIMSTVAETSATPQVNVPVLDITELARTSSDALLRSISRNCVAIKVSVSAMGNERKIDGAQIQLGDHQVPQELIAGARFKLLPPEIRNPLNKVGQRARLIPYTHGTAFVGGAYLLPLTKNREGQSVAQVVFDRLASLREEYHDLAQDLRRPWERHVEKIREEWPLEYENMSRWLVSGDTFVRMHHISTMLFPLGSGLPADFDNKLENGLNRQVSDTSQTETDRDSLRRVMPRVNAIVRAASQDVGGLLSEQATSSWVVDAQAATSEAIAEAVRNMIQEPMTEFAQSLAHVESMLQRGSNLRAVTLENLKQAYTKLVGFSFMAPEDLKDRLRGVGTLLNGVDVKELNSSESTSKELAGAFANIRETLTSESTHGAVFGQFMRNLDI